MSRDFRGRREDEPAAGGIQVCKEGAKEPRGRAGVQAQSLSRQQNEAEEQNRKALEQPGAPAASFFWGGARSLFVFLRFFFFLEGKPRGTERHICFSWGPLQETAKGAGLGFGFGPTTAGGGLFFKGQGRRKGRGGQF